MFRPTLYKNRVTEISLDDLKKLGVEALFLDVDNTLSTHHGKVYVEGLQDWLDLMSASGIKLILTSNSKNERVEPFAKGLKLDYIAMSLKPLSSGFRKAKRKLNIDKKKICVVGDQLFTDVLGAKLYGVKVILLEPILLEDKPSFKFKRKLERIIFKIEKIGGKQ